MKAESLLPINDGKAGFFLRYAGYSIFVVAFALSTDKTDSKTEIKADASCSLHSSMLLSTDVRNFRIPATV